MHLPRRHYREIARALVDNPNAETAQNAAQAINDLLEERTKLSARILRNSPPPPPPNDVVVQSRLSITERLRKLLFLSS